MRCFIALPLPGNARAAIASIVDELKPHMGRLNWVAPEGWHLTLAFLGEIDEAGLACAEAALDAAWGFPRFGASLSFPPRDGPGVAKHVLGLTMSSGEPEATRLYRLVNAALAERAKAAGLGRLNPDWPDGRPFSPHMTLARSPSSNRSRSEKAAQDTALGRLSREVAARIADFEADMVMDACILYKSELRPGGAVYREIKKVQLAAT